MEQQPNDDHERERLTSQCANEKCGQIFEVAPENSRIDSWNLMPDCDYVFTYCPHCEEYYMKLFLRDVNKQAYVDLGFEVHQMGDYPPKHIIESFKNVYGEEPFDPRAIEESPEIVEPPTKVAKPDPKLEKLVAKFEASKRPMTDRQEIFARYFAYLMLHNHLTPEEFRNVQGDLYL